MMPDQGTYYSTNEANAATWPQNHTATTSISFAPAASASEYSSRYIGSLVADFHRTLLKGGVFLYPPTL